ncbi:MAG: putative phage tail protein [Porcipelethomonas sp.]
MNLFGNDFENSYEELITFYPELYSDVYEMQEILKAQGRLADDVVSGIEHIFSNQFLETADNEVISKFEKLLGIKGSKESIEARRAMVKAYMIGTGKISASLIREMIRAYTGADVSCDFDSRDEHGNYILNITAERGNSSFLNLADLYTALSAKIPAHIQYSLDICCQSNIEIVCECEVCSNILPDCGVYLCGFEPGGVPCF